MFPANPRKAHVADAGEEGLPVATSLLQGQDCFQGGGAAQDKVGVIGRRDPFLPPLSCLRRPLEQRGRGPSRDLPFVCGECWCGTLS